MKILALTENFPPETNAAANRMYERARYWADWGHDVTVVTTAPNFPQGELHEGYKNSWYRVEWKDGIKVVRVKSFIAPNRDRVWRILDFLSFLLTGFVGGVVQREPDVVLATSPQFFTAVAGWLVGVVRRVPFVFELGDIWPASIIAVGVMKPGMVLRILERLELFMYRHSAAVAALTPAFKRNLMHRGIAGDKIAVVLNGVELSNYGPRPRNAALSKEWNLQDSFVVGYIGTHGMAHRLQNVLDAADRLRGVPRIRFLFVGDGAERPALIASARERSLDNVILQSSIPKQLVPDIWGLCDVALVHLRKAHAMTEVIPSKIFEAMAMKLPILLAAPAGDASRLIALEGAGLHVPAEDPEALVEAILRLERDNSLRNKLAEAGRGSAHKYTRRRQAEEMLQVLEIAAAGWGDRAGIASDAETYKST